MKVDLFCVQPYMRPEDYLTPEAFFHKIDGYFQIATRKRTLRQPAVIVFPEDLATFLLLEGQGTLLNRVQTMDQAFRAIGQQKGLALLAAMIEFHTIHMKRAFFTQGAARVWHIWHGTMTRLAREYQMTVVAGSALMPESRGNYDMNMYQPKNSRIYNLSFTVAPDGHVFYHTRKVNLVPTQEDILDLSPGPLNQAVELRLLPETDIPMATAICYDAFSRPHTSSEPHFVNVLAELDRQGARLIAQPSANPWWWNERWPFDPAHTETRLRRQQWDEEGSMNALETCQNIEVLINPQLLLEFLDIHFDGESRILGREHRQVRVLAQSHGTRGPEAELVLHYEWNFSRSDGLI